MFVNFSNHPSEQWGSKQKLAASKFGEIRDVRFPAVSPMATTEEVVYLAQSCVEEILALQPDCVMCQGEFSLSLAVINRLQAKGICCVCACSERKVVEKQGLDGTTQKISVFEFQQFRKYAS